ncbi:hypothetical protein NCCP691_40690 [Noviherbaspirillum aridicola]|uniref:Uncharacterized protein n=1 Tax=Noviherbaspirillum aridicola TaxID=2849687 RepID=A0ABQ4QB84_9BURK|nr:hypothetical protein NCCP691_40690 [Noviherbaspirillum aridicola]
MANGWTPERRAKQAAAIRNWRPWEQSSGPKSDAGKERSAKNAYKHGGRSAEMHQVRELMKRLRQFMGGAK